MMIRSLIGALLLIGLGFADSNTSARTPTKAANVTIDKNVPIYHYDWQEKLHLSPEQLEVFRKILRNYRLQNRFIQADYTHLFVLNRNLFDHNTYDFEYYKNQALKIEKHRIEVERDFFQKIHAILSPKQREIFARNIEEWSIRR